MTTKNRLHELVDRLPDDETNAAARFLQYLCDVGSDPMRRALGEAPDEDELAMPVEGEMLPSREEAELTTKAKILDDWEPIIARIAESISDQFQVWASWESVPVGCWVEVGLLLWSRDLSSMRWAYDMIIHGYYDQAAIMIRQIYEDQLMILYLEQKPDLAERFYEQDTITWRFKTMAADLKITWWEDHYATLSRLSHPRDLAAAASRQGVNARIGPRYDHDSETAYDLIFTMFMQSVAYSIYPILVLVDKTGNKLDNKTLIERLRGQMQELLRMSGNIRDDNELVSKDVAP